MRDAASRHEVVVVTSPLSRANYAGLSEMPGWLRGHGVRGWTIELREPMGPVLPRLGIALPHALLAVRRASQLRLPAYVRGFPTCLLGPMADRRREVAAGSFAPPCSGCRARESCAGLPVRYIEQFAGDELRPRLDAPAPDPKLLEGPLADAFARSEL